MAIRVDFIKKVFDREKSVLSNIMFFVRLFVCFFFSISYILRGLFHPPENLPTPRINCVSCSFGKLRFLHENVGILARDFRKMVSEGFRNSKVM